MLSNTIYRLKSAKKLTLGFFGGSITEGAGSSDASRTSWRGAVTEWFKATYPEVEISAIQGAIGGTGSALGIFRIERDLLSKKPDLVFIEFSVNDGAAANYVETMKNSETLVRKILKANPYAEIIYVHTTTKSISDHLASGREYNARSAHSAVMHHYGITQLDVGEILRAEILASGGDWMRLTTDSVHPNDDGYAIYTRAVVELLESELAGDTVSPAEAQLPPPLTDETRLPARLVDASEAALDGFELVEKPMCWRYDHYVEALEPGASLEFSFTGRRVGLYLMLAVDSGDLLWSVEGSEEKPLRTWDHYCKSFNRAGGMGLTGDLEYGEHVLKLRVAETKSEESKGNAIRIGAFMVY